jgi:hypothetical protein
MTRYQYHPNTGGVPHCLSCGEPLRSWPVYDGFPNCKRKRCLAKREVACRRVFDWLASVQHQAGCFGGVESMRLRARVVDDRIELDVLTRDRRLAKTDANWFALACTGEWSERNPQRPEHGVTSTRYSCALDVDAFAAVLARFVRREPARQQSRTNNRRPHKPTGARTRRPPRLVGGSA